MTNLNLPSPSLQKSATQPRPNKGSEHYTASDIRHIADRAQSEILNNLKHQNAPKGEPGDISQASMVKLSEHDNELFTGIDTLLNFMLQKLSESMEPATTCRARGSETKQQKLTAFDAQLQKLGRCADQIIQLAIRELDVYKNNSLNLQALADIGMLKDPISLKKLNPLNVQTKYNDSIQIIHNTNITANNKFTLIKPAPMPTTEVISGGAAKVIALDVQLYIRELFGHFKNLQTVSGCSAGAIAATLMSCMSAKDTLAFSDTHSMKKMLSTATNFDLLYGKELISNKIDFKNRALKILMPNKIGMKAGNIIQELDRVTSASVFKFLNGNAGEVIFDTVNSTVTFDSRTTTLNTEQMARLLLLKSINVEEDFQSNTPRHIQCEGVQNQGEPPVQRMITFSDMAMLHKIAPKHFKELETNGVEYKKVKTQGVFTTRTKIEKILVDFNKDNTPDMPIALATRISAALPIALQPVNYQNATYADGGLLNSLPYNNFVDITQEYNVSLDASQAEQEREQARRYRDHGQEQAHINTHATVLKAPNTEELIYRSKESSDARASSRAKLSLKERVTSHISQRITDKLFDDNTFEKNHEQMGPNHMISHYGDLKPTDFDANLQRQMLAKVENLAYSLEQTNNRQNQAVYFSFDSLPELLTNVTEEEIIQFLYTTPVNTFNDLLSSLAEDDLNVLMDRVIVLPPDQVPAELVKKIQYALDNIPI